MILSKFETQTYKLKLSHNAKICFRYSKNKWWKSCTQFPRFLIEKKNYKTI